MKKWPKPKDILDIVCECFGTEADDIMDVKQIQEVTYLRAVAYRFAKQHCAFSLPQIALAFGVSRSALHGGLKKLEADSDATIAGIKVKDAIPEIHKILDEKFMLLNVSRYQN